MSGETSGPPSFNSLLLMPSGRVSTEPQRARCGRAANFLHFCLFAQQSLTTMSPWLTTVENWLMGELIRGYIPSWIKHDMCYLYCGFACVVRLLFKSTENADLVKKIFEIIYSLKIREISLKSHTDIGQKGVINPTNTWAHTCTQTPWWKKQYRPAPTHNVCWSQHLLCFGDHILL